jgi:hypothetical protein
LGPDFIPRNIDTEKVSALRGKLSLELASGRFGAIKEIPLGDPALLMRMFYEPRYRNKKNGPLGLFRIMPTIVISSRNLTRAPE